MTSVRHATAAHRGSRAGGVAEVAGAVIGFAVIVVAGVGPQGMLGPPRSVAGTALLVAVLVGGYLAFGVGAVAQALQRIVQSSRARLLAATGVLWLVVVVYAALSGLEVLPRAAAFAGYLLAPALLLPSRPTPPARPPIRELGAVALLWLPVELRLLPPLPINAAGYDATRFVGLVDALFLFVIARPLPNVGYTFALRRRDVSLAVLAFLIYSAVALPLGFATGFIVWHPRVSAIRVGLAPPLIYLLTALPEEFLFRGLIQNLLARWWAPARALGVTAVVFGLAHLPDPRYVLLAAVAGLAYGWVYQRTGRITASAVTHALVDAVWVILLHR